MNAQILELLDRLASEAPTPGGGSASALAGALAAALGAMVCRLTEQKAEAGVQSGEGAAALSGRELAELLAELEGIRRELAAGFDRDAESYQEVLAAFRLPKATEDEKAARSRAVQEGLQHATLVPLENARLCARALAGCSRAAERGYQPSVTDAGVGTLLAFAGIIGCLYNVELNLQSVRDEAFVAGVHEEAAALRAAAWSGFQDADRTVLARIAE